MLHWDTTQTEGETRRASQIQNSAESLKGRSAQFPLSECPKFQPGNDTRLGEQTWRRALEACQPDPEPWQNWRHLKIRIVADGNKPPVSLAFPEQSSQLGVFQASIEASTKDLLGEGRRDVGGETTYPCALFTIRSREPGETLRSLEKETGH